MLQSVEYDYFWYICVDSVVFGENVMNQYIYESVDAINITQGVRILTKLSLGVFTCYIWLLLLE